MKRLQYKISLTLFGILIGSLISFSLFAQAPEKLQAAIFIKLLNYDAGLAAKNQKQIQFHIVIDSATQGNKNSLKSDFSIISKQKIAGKTISVRVTDVSALASATTADAIHVYYLPNGTAASSVSTVLKLAKEHKIPLLAGNDALVKKGAAVGVTLANQKPQIIVNLKQSKVLGMALSSQLLKLAKVI